MSLNILVVANVITPLGADDQWVSDRLTGAGHSVTTRLDTASTPSLNSFDLIVLCRSCSMLQLGAKYDAVIRGIVGLGPFPHSKYVAATTASTTGNQTTIYVLPAANGDFLAAAATGTVTVTSVASTWAERNSSLLGSGCVLVLAQNSGGLIANICGSHYDNGAVMSDGSTTAPGRLVHLGMSTGYANSNATQQGMFDNAISWAASGFVSRPSDTTSPVLSTVGLSGSATGVVGTPSWSWSHISGPSSTLSSTSAQNPTYTAPAAATIPDVWALTVTDSGTGLTSTANCTVTYTNAAPTASTGGSYTAQATGTPASTTFDVILSGSGSSDPEGGSLTHSWRIVSTTSGSASLINATSVAPTIRADKYGCKLTIGNTVTDSGGVSSTETTSTVTVNAVAYKWYTHNGLQIKRQRFTAHSGLLV